MRGEHVVAAPRPPPDHALTVHPCIREEHRCLAWRSVRNICSSPHPQGTRSRSSRGRRDSTVHPRIRGEHPSSLFSSALAAGSSPHPRGTLQAACAAEALVRFIPASAGNTSDAIAALNPATVHPRIRGEHRISALLSFPGTGSSPHPRGTPRAQPLECLALRFIPASAGNTRTSRGSRIQKTVHPRIRGEHRLAFQQVSGSGGSSPHPRGTPSARSARRCPARFIPASAGNTEVGRRYGLSNPVHPRIRGEHPASSSS